MRLLHVVPSYLPATRYGGPIYSVHSLCAALARRGHDVSVFTTNVDGDDVSPVPLNIPVDIDGVQVRYFATGWGRRLYRSSGMAGALATDISTFDALHLHSVFLWPTMVAAHYARAAGVPYLIAPRGMLVGDLIRRKSTFLKRSWIEVFERRNLGGAAAVHVTSEVEAEEIRRLNLRVRRFAIVPNGIDLPLLDRSTPRGYEKRQPMVLCLGRVSWKKGLDQLIAAIALIPVVQLVVAGNDDENYRPRLEEFAKSLGVADRVSFIGAVHGDAKWRLISSADVFALTSCSENFGNVVLEAMACSVPVVVTASVGLAKTVAETESGLVVEGAAAPAAIACALSRLLASGAECARMGANGRRTARERFSWDAIAATMEWHYARAIRHDASARRVK